MFDSAKRHLASGGWGKAVSLSKAKYAITCVIRAVCFGALPHSPLILDQPLSKAFPCRSINMPRAPEPPATSASTLKQGDAANIFVSIPIPDCLHPKPGDLFGVKSPWVATSMT